MKNTAIDCYRIQKNLQSLNEDKVEMRRYYDIVRHASFYRHVSGGGPQIFHPLVFPQLCLVPADTS